MKTLSAVLAATGAAALVLVGASPAVAAGNAIDPGDSLYAIACDSSVPPWQLLSVESTTAASTAIGTGTADPAEGTCAGQPAWDFTANKSYYIQWAYDGQESTTSLATIDTATGLSTTIGEFIWVNGEFPTPIDVDAIAIGPNSDAYAVADGDLYSLNLSNADLVPIGSTLYDTYAFAFDQKTSQYYAITFNGSINVIDVTDGTFDFVANVVVPDTYGIYSLQFDQAGTFWIEADDDSDSGAGLWSFTLATVATPVYSGQFENDPYYTEALLIIFGSLALADTGAELSSVAPIAAGAAGIALLGAALILAKRRRAA